MSVVSFRYHRDRYFRVIEEERCKAKRLTPQQQATGEGSRKTQEARQMPILSRNREVARWTIHLPRLQRHRKIPRKNKLGIDLHDERSARSD